MPLHQVGITRKQELQVDIMLLNVSGLGFYFLSEQIAREMKVTEFKRRNIGWVGNRPSVG